jgi:hypothetical protein
MNSLEKQVVEWLKGFRPSSSPTDKESESPNYPMYALAPFWRPHQAVCLLGDIATIDVDSFRAMLSLTPLQRLLGAVPRRGQDVFDPSVKKFSAFISQRVQCLLPKTDFLKNIQERINQACQDGTLHMFEKECRGVKEKLLDPEIVIEWAKKAGIPVPSKLVEEMKKRSKVNPIYFPFVFPDEINLHYEYEKRRILTNHKSPLSPSSLGRSPTTKEERETLFPSVFKEVNPNIEKLYKTLISARNHVILLFLDHKFPESEGVDEQYLSLIQEHAQFPKETLVKYGEREPSYLKIKHLSIVAAKMFRHFDQKIPIKEIMQDSFMRECVFNRGKPPTLGTFRDWMNEAGIFDKERKSKGKK